MQTTILILSCLAAAVAAQSPSLPPPVPQIPDTQAAAKPVASIADEPLAHRLQDAVLFDVAADGTLFAAAANHKADFGPAGFRFVARPKDPLQNSEPIAFTMTQVLIAGEPQPLAAAPPHRDGQRISWQRGSCREQVDFGRYGAEQSFVFEALPQRGEIVLHIAARTDRVGRDLGDGILFAGRSGDVAYAEAMAIDADGRRTPAATDYDAGRITIRVPAAFVANARLPLVIDPLINSTTAYSTAFPVGHSDLAYDASSQTYMVAFERYFSADDIDVYCQRLSSTMMPLGNYLTVDSTYDVWALPKIANLNAYDRYLVVAQTSVDAPGPFSIRGRVVDATGSMATPQLDIATQGFVVFNRTAPDVAGDSAANGPTYWTVVWQTELSAVDHDIYMLQIQFDGTPRALTSTPILVNPLIQARPRISESSGNGAANRVLCIVYEQPINPLSTDIYGALRTWDGQLVPGVAATFPIDLSVVKHQLPTVSSPTAGPNGEFLVVYEAPFQGSGDIVMSCVSRAGTVLASASLTAVEGATAGAWPQYRPCVDSDGTRWAVSYTELFGGSGADQDIRTSLVARVGTQLFVHEARVQTAYTSSSEFDATCCSTFSGSGNALAEPAHGIAHSRFDTSFSIGADLYLGHGNLAGYTVRPTGCGNLNMLSTGVPILGQPFGFLTVQSYPLQGYVFGTPISVPLPGCAGCIAGVDGIMVAGPTLTITVPTNASLFGVSFSTQGFAIGGGTCFGNLSISETYDFVIQ